MSISPIDPLIDVSTGGEADAAAEGAAAGGLRVEPVAPAAHRGRQLVRSTFKCMIEDTIEYRME